MSKSFVLVQFTNYWEVFVAWTSHGDFMNVELFQILSNRVLVSHAEIVSPLQTGPRAVMQKDFNDCYSLVLSRGGYDLGKCAALTNFSEQTLRNYAAAIANR